jgi:hypothetical protein
MICLLYLLYFGLSVFAIVHYVFPISEDSCSVLCNNGNDTSSLQSMLRQCGSNITVINMDRDDRIHLEKTFFCAEWIGKIRTDWLSIDSVYTNAYTNPNVNTNVNTGTAPSIVSGYTVLDESPKRQNEKVGTCLKGVERVAISACEFVQTRSFYDLIVDFFHTSRKTPLDPNNRADPGKRFDFELLQYTTTYAEVVGCVVEYIHKLSLEYKCPQGSSCSIDKVFRLPGKYPLCVNE